MMTFDEMQQLIASVSYKPGWTLSLFEDSQGRPYIQLAVSELAEASLDSANPENGRVPWKSGKRYLSPFMCRQEIVGSAFDLIKSAEMHECHEWFRYKGASIYNPHLDPDVLVQIARRGSSFNVRENAMSMDETDVA